MKVLTVATPAHRLHQNVFGGHEGQLLPQMLFDHPGIDGQPARHIAVQCQQAIGAQKALGHGDPAVGAVIQRALQPLLGRRHGSVLLVGNQKAGQCRHALRAHGVALVCHGGGPDLLLFKGLLDLLAVGQQADVVGEFVGALPDLGQNGERPAVHLAGVGLPRHRHRAVKAHLPTHHVVQLLHLVIVAVKQLQKAGLGARGALGSQGPQVIQKGLHGLQVVQQILQPQGGPLAHRHRLRRLKVGEPQRGQGLVLLREGVQRPGGHHQPGPQQLHALAQDDDIRVVAHVAAGGAQVDDWPGQGAGIPKGVHMGHHIVAQAGLVAGSGLQVDIIQVLPHLAQLGIGDGQPQLLLAFGQPQPQPAPQAELVLIGKQGLHGFACIALRKRGPVSCLFRHVMCLLQCCPNPNTARPGLTRRTPDPMINPSHPGEQR